MHTWRRGTVSPPDTVEGQSCAPRSAPARYRRCLQALNLAAVNGPLPSQEGGTPIELELGRISTGTTRRTRLGEYRRNDFTPLDRPYQERTVEHDVFGKERAHLAGCSVTRFP